MATKTFNVSFPEPLAKRLDKLASRQKMSRSEILRAGARSYMNRMERWDEMAREMKSAAKRLGIRTMDDVDRIVHEVRDEIAAEKSSRKRA